MEEAIAANAKICALGGLQGDVAGRWPRAQFVYKALMSDLVDAFEAGECNAIASGQNDIRMSTSIVSRFCEQTLVSSGVLVHTIAVGLPAAPNVVGGLSHWMQIADNQGVRFQDFLADYEPQLDAGCSLKIKLDDDLGMLQLKVVDMFFCFALLGTCVCLSIGLKLCAHRTERFGIVNSSDEIRQRFIKKIKKSRLKKYFKSRLKNICTILGQIFDEWDKNRDISISREKLEVCMKTFDLHL